MAQYNQSNITNLYTTITNSYTNADYNIITSNLNYNPQTKINIAYSEAIKQIASASVDAQDTPQHYRNVFVLIIIDMCKNNKISVAEQKRHISDIDEYLNMILDEKYAVN